ncbi:hypothetical protein MAHJHV35_46880 [Mycobacterium avium subsp. hominissuis]
MQAGAGLRIHRRPGDDRLAGEPLFTLYTDTPERFGAGAPSPTFQPPSSSASAAPRPLIIDRIVT